LNFIRLRRNTLQLAAGLKGKVNRAEAHQSEGGLLLLYHFNVEMATVNVEMATAQFRFDTPQLVVAKRRSRPAGLRGASLIGLYQH